LIFACSIGHEQVARALIMANASLESKNKDGFTALMICSQNGHDLCTRELIKAKANVNHETPKRVTALNMACDNSHESCAKLLLRAGAHTDVTDAWGDSPLSIAQKKGMAEVLALMQAPAGADDAT